jgi:polyisoprenyl-teichoic acid--peptidoglycan teichoic acid transferase
MRLSEDVEPGNAAGEDGEPTQQGRPEAAQDDHALLRRSLGLTFASAFVPGLGHLLSGKKRIGIALLACYAALLITTLVAALTVSKRRWLELGFDKQALDLVIYGAAFLALAWPLIVLSTFLVSKPDRMSRVQRVISGAVVLVLCVLVAAPLARASQMAYVARHDVLGIFEGNEIKGDTNVSAKNPFEHKPRLNLLIIGGDAAGDRVGIRTDSIMVASVDTHTGRTVLISLPRNLNRAPFPAGTPMHSAYPNGFHCQPAINCYLNAVYQYGQEHPQVVGQPTKHPGAELLSQTVGEMLGMKIDYYILAEIFGFKNIVDALGGVTLRVKERIPVGGRTDANGRIIEYPVWYIEPGLRHLDGEDALWYGRARFGSDDYQRMIRQRCLLGAIARQADPVRVLFSFNQIAKAAKKLVATDLPRALMPALLELASSAKSAKITGVSIDRSVFGGNNDDPSYGGIRREAQRIMRSETAAATKPSSSPSSSSSGASAQSSSSPSAHSSSSHAATSPARDLFASGQCSYS